MKHKQIDKWFYLELDGKRKTVRPIEKDWEIGLTWFEDFSGKKYYCGTEFFEKHAEYTDKFSQFCYQIRKMKPRPKSMRFSDEDYKWILSNTDKNHHEEYGIPQTLSIYGVRIELDI